MAYTNLKKATEDFKESLRLIDERSPNRCHDLILKQNTRPGNLDDPDAKEAYSNNAIKATANIACILLSGLQSMLGISAYLVSDELSGLSKSYVSLDNNLTFLDENRRGVHVFDEVTRDIAVAMVKFLDAAINDKETAKLLKSLPPTINLVYMRECTDNEINHYDHNKPVSGTTSRSTSPTDTNDSNDDDDFSNFSGGPSK